MGKPIAARNKYPFGINGIRVAGAVLKDGTKLTNLKISKQRSINVFDLLSEDGLTTYEFVSITGVKADGYPLDKSKSDDELTDDIAKNTFFIRGIDVTGVDWGFVIRLMLHKVTLQDGHTLFDWDMLGVAPISVDSVSVLPASATINIGATQQLAVTVLPADASNKSVTYQSDDISILTVSNSGLVTAVAKGTANITVTTVDGSKTAVSAITVRVPVESVSLAPTTASIAVGNTQQLTPTVLPANANNTNVTYTSDKPEFATVSSTGLVTAVAVGVAVITVTTADNSKTATSTITVTA